MLGRNVAVLQPRRIATMVVSREVTKMPRMVLLLQCFAQLYEIDKSDQLL